MGRAACLLLGIGAGLIVFQLSATEASTWRQALSQTTAEAAQAWAAAVQACDLAPPHGRDKLALVEPFFVQTSPAVRVVAVLESLVEEQLLSRAEATQIEERVFQRIDRTGQWVWGK